MALQCFFEGGRVWWETRDETRRDGNSELCWQSYLIEELQGIRQVGGPLIGRSWNSDY